MPESVENAYILAANEGKARLALWWLTSKGGRDEAD